MTNFSTAEGQKTGDNGIAAQDTGYAATVETIIVVVVVAVVVV
eukprot:CAMPEP_0184862614 /NCGR_PEP_ID=MMETSP0580-20130426/7063_1 /TAXON_ID=1118495 /ORGANISM="Dactyliosolen fragilissimus" /LENGTH=42 /DNA_ID= /DNA_START= /DNA_END= /DNA_ORIENTATION=